MAIQREIGSDGATPIERQAVLAPQELWLPAAERLRIEQWATAGYPYEACGLLIGRVEGERTLAVRAAEARNLNSERPNDRYLLDPEDFLAADRSARAEGLDVVGVWHSHPDHSARPSATDLESAWGEYSYLIITTTARGAGELRCWRLNGGEFGEESIRQEEIEA